MPIVETSNTSSVPDDGGNVAADFLLDFVLQIREHNAGDTQIRVVLYRLRKGVSTALLNHLSTSREPRNASKINDTRGSHSGERTPHRWSTRIYVFTRRNRRLTQACAMLLAGRKTLEAASAIGHLGSRATYRRRG